MVSLLTVNIPIDRERKNELMYTSIYNVRYFFNTILLLFFNVIPNGLNDE